MVLNAAPEELRVLQSPSDAPTPNQMMTRYLNGLAEQAFARRTTEREALKTPGEVAAYQQRMRELFISELGGFPERTPLNARVVGSEQREGFRFEKVIYESRPGMFVTGIVFLPLSNPPYPGVLIPCGHSDNGKANEPYQRAAMFLAMNGIAALVYDPIGQGERYQFLDANGKPRFGSTTEHTIVGVGCIALGTNTAAYRIWDGIRSLDYLTSRPDIDPNRIGCTGNSGGGTLTSYLMALDPRIQCAAPSCYLTTLGRLLAEAGPQDAEQNIHGQIAHGMDHADYVMMRAPKPTLMCCATRDFFDIAGTWDSFRQAKRLYTKLGFAERVDLVESDAEHGFGPPLRQAAVRWMRRWLLNTDDAVTEREMPLLTEQELRCTPDGQVMRMKGARSVIDFNEDLERKLAKERRAFWKTTPKDLALARVREIAGIRRLADLPEPKAEPAGSIDRGAYRIEKLVLETDPGILLPCLVFVPPNPNPEAFLYVHGEDKSTDAGPGGPIEKLVREGHIVLAPDLRGIGETASASKDKGWNAQFGGGWQDFFRAYMLNKSYVGMRAEDIMVSARYLAKRDGADRRVHLIAVGEAVPPALHAAALEPGLFTSTRFEKAPRSWADTVRSPFAANQLMNMVHGALRVYDLPDLESIVSAKRR